MKPFINLVVFLIWVVAAILSTRWICNRLLSWYYRRKYQKSTIRRNGRSK